MPAPEPLLATCLINATAPRAAGSGGTATNDAVERSPCRPHVRDAPPSACSATENPALPSTQPLVREWARGYVDGGR